MVSTPFKRLWLRRLYAQVVATTYASLLAGLEAVAFASMDTVKSGSIAATARNGHSIQFSTSDNGTTQEDAALVGGEMLDLYDLANAELIASGIPTPTDEQIYTEMLDRLQPVRSVTSDYRCLRFDGVATNA